MGVDEVQFDYIRFPDKRTESTTFDQGVSLETRTATIIGFLEEAVALLHPMGCAVGADVFGFTTAAADDGGIGQNWDQVTQVVDVASPMVYPSHYTSGWYEFETPNDHPGPMVTNAIQTGWSACRGTWWFVPGCRISVTRRTRFEPQIEVAEEYGLGWMLWNAESNVTVDASWRRNSALWP